MNNQDTGIFLSDPQSYYVHSMAASVAAIAGFGSGKTFAAFAKILKWLIDFPGIPMGYFAPTVPLIRDIFIPEAEAFCAQNNLLCHYDKQEGKLYMQGFAPVFCRSMHIPENIVGFQIGHAAVDEIDILPTDKAWLAWRKIKARCRIRVYKPGKKKKKKNELPNQMALASTPEGYKFAYQAFRKDPLKGSQMFQLSTYDNEANLPVGYIEELKSNYPAALFDAYVMGIFTNLTSGRVWTGYEREANRSLEVWDGKEPIIVGMDFNVERGCAVTYVKRPTGFHAVGEVTKTRDTPATIKAIDERYPNTHITVIPDASGKARKSVNATTSDIKLLKQAGYYVIRNESNPNIKDRVTATNAMFCNAQGQRHLYVNDTECPFFSESLETQAYDSNGLPEKGVTMVDDITDAGTYPIAKLFPVVKPNARLRKAAGI